MTQTHGEKSIIMKQVVINKDRNFSENQENHHFLVDLSIISSIYMIGSSSSSPHHVWKLFN